jgi:hypothetical protein
MDEFGALGVMQRIWPRLVAILVLAALYFFPQTSANLIARAAEHRAQRITSLISDALGPTVAWKPAHPKNQLPAGSPEHGLRARALGH